MKLYNLGFWNSLFRGKKKSLPDKFFVEEKLIKRIIANNS